MATEALVQWDQISGLKRSKLDLLVSERVRVKAEIAERVGEVARLDSKIAAALISADVKTCGVGDGEKLIRVTFVPPGVSHTFDKALAQRRLLELGVPEKKVLKAWKDATEEKPKSGFVKITLPGEKE